MLPKRVREKQRRPVQHAGSRATQARYQPEVVLPKGYRVMSVSLYADQAESVDRAAETLLHAGFAKANRSLVVQTAIQRLREDLEGKTPTETVMYFPLFTRICSGPCIHAARRRRRVAVAFRTLSRRYS